MCDRRQRFPVPEGFNPFEYFYAAGEAALKGRLAQMDNDHLKGIISRFTAMPRKEYAKVSNRDVLLDLTLQGIKMVTCRGQAFGDYKLD